MIIDSVLAAAWNEAGRKHYSELNRRLELLYAKRDESVEFDLADPRTEEQGDAILKAVVALNEEGQWQRARELFDPAISPLMKHVRKNDRQLGFVTLLGEDDLLVRRGSPWQSDGVTFRLRDGKATELSGVRAMAMSRNRQVLVLAAKNGLEFRDAEAGVESPPMATLAWPAPEVLRPLGLSEEQRERWTVDPAPLDIESLQVSNDGMRVAVSAYRQGVLLASRHEAEPSWQLLLPDARAPYDYCSEAEEGEPLSFSADMTHVAMSADGTRFAFGEQGSVHFLAEAKLGHAPKWYASVGNFSEYPHYAWFSDDGNTVALNSCHFYNGATLAFDWREGQGVTLPAYKEDDLAPVCDDMLRVYAACWLQGEVIAKIVPDAPKLGAFVLGGAGLIRCVHPNGQLVYAQGFGSSASSIDYCPKTGQLALGSYSGIVHVYDVNQEELPGRVDGWRARREIRRWILWEQLGHPIVW